MNTAEVVAIFENDVERDRKTCLGLATRATGANRELAQWLLDHPRYSAVLVSEWLGVGYSKSNIIRLRRWAKDGFIDSPHANTEADNERRRASRSPVHRQLKSQDNLEMPTEEEADESWQNDLHDQACLLLERMADATRQRFFATIKERYGYGQN